MTDSIEFGRLVPLLSMPNRGSSKSFRKFLDDYCKPEDYFSAVRLIIPAIDRERCDYGPTDSILEACFDALDVSNPNESSAGKAKIEAELKRKVTIPSTRITVKEVNDCLDILALKSDRAAQSSILASLIEKTDSHEMICIINKIIFHDFEIPLWYSEEELTTGEDSRFYKKESVTLLRLLRRREKSIQLVVRYNLSMEQHETLLPNSSPLVHLGLEKRFRTFDASRVYSIFDERSNSLDIWGVRKNSEEDPPIWTTLNTKKMHRFHSCGFSEDEDFSLMSLLLSRGVEPFCFLPDPPVKISLHGVFVPHPVDSLDTFPHNVSVTITPSRTIYQAKHQQKCNKIAKGCLFVFTKPSLTDEQLDYNLVKFREFQIPKFVFDRISADMSGEVPETSKFVLSVVHAITSSPPEDLEGLVALKRQLSKVPVMMKFRADEYLVVLVLSTNFMLELDLLGFVEELCKSLAHGLRAAQHSTDPTRYVLDLLDLKDDPLFL